jgi:phage FluMu protein Com
VDNNTGLLKQGVTCSKCGGVIKRFLAASAYSIVCPHCETTYNAFSNELEKTTAVFKKIYKAFDLPIGSKGVVKGTSYLVVGYTRKKKEAPLSFGASICCTIPLKVMQHLPNTTGTGTLCRNWEPHL